MAKVYGVRAGNKVGIPEDKTKCIKSVYDVRYYSQCSHKRGHGKDGLYCKIHAVKHPDMTQEYPDIWIASWGYRQPNLVKAKLIKETAKTYAVTEKEDVIGSIYTSTRISKENTPFFYSKREALIYLVSQAEDRIESLEDKYLDIENEITDANRTIDNLNDMLNLIK